MKKLILLTLVFLVSFSTYSQEVKVPFPAELLLPLPDSVLKSLSPKEKKRMMDLLQKYQQDSITLDLPLPQTIWPELGYRNYPTPENGFSPYDSYLGKGVYDNSSGNEFVIKNSNKSDAVVLLVNAYSEKKVRNEFIRKGTNFSMTGVPHGTYYLHWFSGNNWSPTLKIGGFIGGFQTNQSFSKTRDLADWMKVSGYEKWEVTLYTVEEGDVAIEDISPEDFLN